MFLSTQNLQAATYEVNRNDASKNQKDDSIIVKSINKEDLTKIKQQVNNTPKNRKEIYSNHLQKLGYTKREIESFKEDDLNTIFENSESISTEEKYVVITEDNEEILMEKDICLEHAKKADEYQKLELYTNSKNEQFKNAILDNNIINKSLLARATNDSKNYDTQKYMKITTMSIYFRPGTKGQKGWYQFYGMFTWLSAPKDRLTDAISLYADNFAWSQKNSDYVSTLRYKGNEVSSSGIKTTEYSSKKTTSKKVQTDGLYYTWALPKDGIFDVYAGTHYYCSDIILTIKGKARVSQYTLPCTFNLFTKYAHLQSYLVVKPSFSWSIGKLPGVTFTGGKGVKEQQFCSYNTTNYSPYVNIK